MQALFLYFSNFCNNISLFTPKPFAKTILPLSRCFDHNTALVFPKMGYAIQHIPFFMYSIYSVIKNVIFHRFLLINLHIRLDCSSAISMHLHTFRGYHTVLSNQVHALLLQDHSSMLRCRPVFLV